MFCKECGKQIPDDSRYCPFCGESLAEVADMSNKRQNDIEMHIDAHRYNRDILNYNKSDKANGNGFPKNVSIISRIALALNLICMIYAVATIGVSASGGSHRPLVAKGVVISIAIVLFLINAILNFVLFFLCKGQAFIGNKYKRNPQFTVRLAFLMFTVIISALLIVSAISSFRTTPISGKDDIEILGPCISCGLMFFFNFGLVVLNNTIVTISKTYQPLTKK